MILVTDSAPPESRAPSGQPRAWLLNLDAELELRRPLRYQPTHASLRACAVFEPVARSLVANGDIVLSRAEPLVAGCAKGYLGAAWCPTPSALAWLARAGAQLEPQPSLECLQRVNHRSFHAGLGQPLDGATFAADPDAARRLLARPRSEGWMVKRGFGFAGRSNRRFPSEPSADDWRWLDHAFLDGGVQIEPWLAIESEFSLHGRLERDGSAVFGVACTRLEAAPPHYAHADQTLSSSEREALYAEAERTRVALAGAGYFGPFGIDAFRYSTAGGVRFNPRSEINARHTLAYATGMAALACAHGTPSPNRIGRIW